MDIAAFTDPAGELVTQRPLGGGQHVAFVPHPLPPPPIVEQAAIAATGALLAEAEYALGQLTGLAGLLADANALAALYIRQEAVRSSQIEGTHTSLLELAAIEASSDTPPSDPDARETMNHVVALEEGLSRIRNGAPLDADLLCDLHRTLMTGAQGEALSAPGQLRDVQNYVMAGRSVVYTPPPPAPMLECLASLFDYIEASHETPPLAEIAWAHYAFEAIHPFRDGNGRVGRILIALLLARQRRLDYPLLYLGSYFFEHRQEYYDRLFAVSAHSDWAGWLAFVLRAIAARARTSIATVRRLVQLDDEWQVRLEQGGATPTALRLAPLIRRQRFAVTAPAARRMLAEAGYSATPPTVYQAIADLERAGIVAEVTGRARGRVWVALELIRLFDGDGGSSPR